MRLRSILFILGVLVLVACFVPHFILQTRVESPEFKAIAEQKVSELLDADVQIGEIKALFLNQIALKRLSVASSEEGASTNRILVQEIIFRYDIFRLISRQFEVPTSIVLNSPEISFRKDLLPYALMRNLQSGRGKGPSSKLELRGGQLNYELPDLDTEINIQDIQGSLSPTEGKTLKIDFRANVQGALNGIVRIRGHVDPTMQSQDFEIGLEKVRFGEKIPIPFEDMTGIVRWEDQNLYFDQLDASVHGWKVSMEGKLLDPNSRPILQMSWKVGKVESLAKGEFELNLQTHKVSGAVATAKNKPMGFYGGVRQYSHQLLFENLNIADRFEGSGWFNLKTGNYHFDIERDKQHIAIESNLKGLNFNLNFNLNHIQLMGFDLVTAASVQLKPLKGQSKERQLQFSGSFDTDYFIWEYTPFDDFEGTFDLSFRGLKNLRATWGTAFQVEGHIDYQAGDPQGKMTVKVKDFDLSETKSFANKPIPKNFGGLLEGKLILEGEISRPKADGKFIVKGGRVGLLEYDRGIIQFQGFAPRLELYDSRILKGRTRLDLEGPIDLSLENIMSGVQVKSGGQIILLKGWEATSAPGEDVELSHGAMPFSALTFKSGSGESDPVIGEPDQKDDGKYIVAGPKFKF